MFVTVSSDEVASDFSAAEQLVAQHQEQQAEVATHEKSVQDFQEAAQKLIKSGHPQSADIKDKNKRLSEAWENLLDCFKKKQGHLEQVKEVQRFKKEADQLEGWLNARDADLMSQDVGDSLEAVEALLKKQDEFENILLAKGNHFQGLMKLTNQEMESEKQKKEQDKELQKQQKIKKKEDEKTIPKNNDEIKDNVKEKSILKPKPKVKPKPKLQEQRKQVNDRELINNEHKINNKAGSEKINSGKQIAKHNTENKPFEERLNQEAKEPEIKPQTSHEQLLQNSIESFPTKEPGDRVEGFLKIKQELDVGRLKPSSRAWKTFYTVFDDGNLLFYMDRTSASNSDPAASLDLKGCRVEEAVIRKNTFRLFVQDGSEFLFTAKDTNDFVRWIDKINTWNQASTESLHSQPAANNGQGNSVQRSQLSNPVITVTSFDSDDSDVDLPLIISPPPDIPPPFLPDDDFQIEVPESYNSDGVDENNTEEDYHNGNEGVGYNGDDIDTVNQYDDANDYVDDFILSEEDIHPEFYPDAPTDFNDNSFPDIPSIPPPQIPPEDFRDLEQGMVDDDDMMVYPKAPPPPVKTKTQISSDQEGYISSGSDGLPSPPKLIKPTQKFNITHGIIPHKKKRAPPPPRDKDPAARYRSDSQDSRGSDDFVPKYPSRPYHDKGVHDDKKQDKKKGMFGFLKKKK